MADHSKAGSGKVRKLLNDLQTAEPDEMELIDPKGAEP